MKLMPLSELLALPPSARSQVPTISVYVDEPALEPIQGIRFLRLWTELDSEGRFSTDLLDTAITLLLSGVATEVRLVPEAIPHGVVPNIFQEAHNIGFSLIFGTTRDPELQSHYEHIIRESARMIMETGSFTKGVEPTQTLIELNFQSVLGYDPYLTPLPLHWGRTFFPNHLPSDQALLMDWVYQELLNHFGDEETLIHHTRTFVELLDDSLSVSNA